MVENSSNLRKFHCLFSTDLVWEQGYLLDNMKVVIWGSARSRWDNQYYNFKTRQIYSCFKKIIVSLLKTYMRSRKYNIVRSNQKRCMTYRIRNRFDYTFIFVSSKIPSEFISKGFKYTRSLEMTEACKLWRLSWAEELMKNVFVGLMHVQNKDIASFRHFVYCYSGDNRYFVFCYFLRKTT